MKTFAAPKVDHLTFAEAAQVCARAGMSRHHTAKHLGIASSVFYPMANELKSIEWPDYANTIGVIERFKARRGHSTPGKRAMA